MCRTFKVTRNRKPFQQQLPYYLAKLQFSLPKLYLENLKQNTDFIRDCTSALILHINVSISACILDQRYNTCFQAAKFDGCVMLSESQWSLASLFIELLATFFNNGSMNLDLVKHPYTRETTAKGNLASLLGGTYELGRLPRY